MDQDPSSGYSSAKVVRPNWGRQNGAGRVKGTPNKLTLHARRVAEMVFGTPGTPEFDEFIAHERAAWKADTMHPAIKSLWMHHLLGKPKETVDVKVRDESADDMTADQIRAEALAIASRLPAPEDAETVQ